MAWEAVEDVRDVKLAAELELWDGRPRGRVIRAGHALGYWSLGLSDGLHWRGRGRPQALPLPCADDYACRPAAGGC
eukprot:11203216-Lingulodinium_polyedra.AAC.1